jgi:hypothetical protein
MPWDGTYLYLATLDANGAPVEAHRIAGAEDESIVQPEWSPDGALYYISDRTGFWNLHHHTEAHASDVERGVTAGVPAELAKPAWVFGMSSYAFVDAHTVLVAYGTMGTYQLATINTTTGQLTDIDTPYTDFNYVRAANGRAVFIAGSPTRRNALVQLDPAATP